MNKKLSRFISRNMMLCIMFVMIIVLAILADGFLQINNILGILRNVAITGVIAFGMTAVIIAGEIDLSIGSTIGLSSVIVAKLSGVLSEAGVMPMESAAVVGMIAAVLVALLVGFINGFIRTRYNIPTFIITLAMLNILYGVADPRIRLGEEAAE